MLRGLGDNSWKGLRAHSTGGIWHSCSSVNQLATHAERSTGISLTAGDGASTEVPEHSDDDGERAPATGGAQPADARSVPAAPSDEGAVEETARK